MAKLMIENVSFKNKSVEFTGTFGKFAGKVLLGNFFNRDNTRDLYGLVH